MMPPSMKPAVASETPVMAVRLLDARKRPGVGASLMARPGRGRRLPTLGPVTGGPPQTSASRPCRPAGGHGPRLQQLPCS